MKSYEITVNQSQRIIKRYTALQLTWNQRAEMVWIHSIYKQQREGYQHMSCSSCKTFSDG